jgi:uncharacterized protein
MSTQSSGANAAAAAPNRPLRMGLFVLLTALFSAPWWWLHHKSGYGGYMPLLMWSPGVAGAVTLKLTGGNLSELAWRGSRLKWIVLAWLVPLTGLTAAYLFVCALGKASFPDHKYVADIAAAMALKGWPVAALVLIHATISATTGVINAGGRALGEELGWRGFFVADACALFGFPLGALLVGAVWALWHVPLLLGDVPLPGMINFVVLVLGMSIAFAWVRLRSRSVWPSTVMHATHNAYRSMFLNPLTIAGAGSALWLDETGYALAAMGVCVGLIFALIPRPDTSADHTAP